MNRLDAFQHMVLSISTCRVILRGRGDDMPAQNLELALEVTEQDLEAGLAEHGNELSQVAREFVDFCFGEGDYDTHGPVFGGRPDNIKAPAWFSKWHESE